MRRIMRSPHILPANPRKRPLSRDQVARKQEKAVDFLERVVGESEVGQTEKTGLELADEIRDLSVEEYAERKGIVMENPSDRQLIEQAITTYLPWDATREDRRSAYQSARKALGECPGSGSETQKVEVVCGAVCGVADQIRERARREEEKSRREMELEIARSKKSNLVQWAKGQVHSYLSQLYSDKEIGRDEWLYPDAELLQEVEAGLREELTATESYEEARELMKELVDNYLFDSEEEDDEEDDDGYAEEFDDEEEDEEEEG